MPPTAGVRLNISERVHLAWAMGNFTARVLAALFMYPFKGMRGGRTFFEYVCRAVSRSLSLVATRREHQALLPESNATKIYNQVTEKHNLPRKVIDVPGGATGFWLGAPDSEQVLLFFPGGGYTLPLMDGHLELCLRLVDVMRRRSGSSVAAFVVQYNLLPSQYPVQLRQCVAALDYLLSIGKAKPSNIIIGGDSAGASLSVSSVAHTVHKHSAIPELNVTERFRGLLLLSPWISMSFPTSGSFKTNAASDFVPRGAMAEWTRDWLGESKADVFAEPAQAGSEHWSTIPVDDILITTGDEEVFYDQDILFADTVKQAKPRTLLYVGKGDPHIAPVFAYSCKLKQSAQLEAIEDWIQALF